MGMVSKNGAAGIETSAIGQADIEQHNVRLMLGASSEGIGIVAGFADRLNGRISGGNQHRFYAAADERAIFNNENTDGLGHG